MSRANNNGWDFVKVDGIYQYKEDWFIATVKVLEDNSDENEYRFRLQIVESNEDPGCDAVIDISHSKEPGGYYSGMLQLYENPEYLFTPKWKNPNPPISK